MDDNLNGHVNFSESNKGHHDWLYALSKGVDLNLILKKIIPSNFLTLDLNYIKCFTHKNGVIYIVLDDNFRQALVILNFERWRELSFNSSTPEVMSFLEKKEVLFTRIIEPVIVPKFDLNDHGSVNSNEISGDISKIIVNLPGSLAVLIGEFYFTVMNVYPISTATKPKYCKSYWINPLTKIVDAKWHPISTSYNHLAILTVDGLLRIYNCFDTDNQPEQILSFIQDKLIYPTSLNDKSGKIPKITKFPRDRQMVSSLIDGRNMNANAINKTEIENEFVSLLFSFAPESGWKALNAYAVTSSGSISMICGVIPSDVNLTRQDAIVLGEQCVELDFNLNSKNENTTNNNQDYWQMRFFEEIKLQTTTNDQEEPYNQRLLLKRPLQNMYLKPYKPLKFFNNNEIIVDMSYINLNFVNIMILSSLSGTVYIGLDVTWATPIWYLRDNSDENKYQLSIEWIESIKLNIDELHTPSSTNTKNFLNKMTLINSERNPHTIYVAHDFGVHGINLNPLIGKLKKIYRDFTTSPSNAPSLKENLPPSIITKIYSNGLISSNKVSFTNTANAFAIINDVYTDSLYISITDSLKLYGGYIQETFQYTYKGENDNDYHLYLSNPEIKERYTCPKICEMYQKYSNTYTENIVNDLNMKTLTYPKFATLPVFKAFYNVSEHFHDGIYNIVNASGDLHKRLNLIEKELECQKALWKELLNPDISKKLNECIQERKSRLETLKKHQMTLNDRSFSLMKLMLDSNNSLTDQELSWFKQISSLNKLINSFYKPQISKLYARWLMAKPILNNIKKELSAIGASINSGDDLDPHKLTPHATQKLHEEYIRRSDVIQNIKKRLINVNQTLENSFSKIDQH